MVSRPLSTYRPSFCRLCSIVAAQLVLVGVRRALNDVPRWELSCTPTKCRLSLTPLWIRCLSPSFSRPRSNGTRTFRRQPTTPFNQTASASTTDVSQNPTGDAPLPSMQTQSAAYDGPASFRYSKEELLDIYRSTAETTSPSD